MMAVARESRSGLPQFSDDPVINFLVQEVCVLQYAKRQEELQKEDERKRWKEQVKDPNHRPGGDEDGIM